MKWIENFLRHPEWRELAQRELAEAQRSLLEAQSAEEYARSVVSYNQERIRRLTAKLQEV